MPKLQKVKVAGFSSSTLDGLMAAINDVTAGKAVLTADSGTVDYPAKWVEGKELLDQQYVTPESGLFTCLLFYTT